MKERKKRRYSQELAWQALRATLEHLAPDRADAVLLSFPPVELHQMIQCLQHGDVIVWGESAWYAK